MDNLIDRDLDAVRRVASLLTAHGVHVLSVKDTAARVMVTPREENGVALPAGRGCLLTLSVYVPLEGSDELSLVAGLSKPERSVR